MNAKLGLAESYMNSEWDSEPNPKEFLSFLILAKKKTKKKCNGIFQILFSCLGRILDQINWICHFLSHNSIQGSRQNIEKHYDLGNEMFELFLDSTMTYSCAIFDEHPKRELTYMDIDLLKAAQLNKYDRILGYIDLKDTDHVLEIGCGWGAFCVRAAKKIKCRWTGLTISREQHSKANKLIKENSIEKLANIKFCDYREESGIYDHIVAIEMIEAVGHEYLDKFFDSINKCLKPNGKFIIQAIVCRDEEYEKYRKSSDFIKKYIFPGGHMPSMEAIKKALPLDLEIKKVVTIGQNYSPTLDICAWIKNRNQIIKMGYTEKFFRTWEMYFSLCSALFLHGHIDTVQIVIQKIQ